MILLMTTCLTYYRVERYPSLGQYDLKILNATYDRDNGQFACMVKEAGTGKTLHTKSVGLTVLLPPSPPSIHPPSPVAIEGDNSNNNNSNLTSYPFPGKPLNLTCSSSGGSPPPQIRWYRSVQYLVSGVNNSVLLITAMAGMARTRCWRAGWCWAPPGTRPAPAPSPSVRTRTRTARCSGESVDIT